jgi:predicted ATP-dependent endonuclease of OLD family
MNNLIKQIEIKGLFHKYDLKWNLNQDVNILVGINGIGKTTILRTVNALLSQKYTYIKDWGMDVKAILTDGSELVYNSNSKNSLNNSTVNFEYITTFDVPLRDKTKIKQNETPLDKELDRLIFPTRDFSKTLLNYRLKSTTSSPDLEEKMFKFFNLVNLLFSETNKKIEIDPISTNLIFRTEDDTIRLGQLSSGEKQILIILLSVFLREEKPFVLLMDEPEISLHIGWQQQLIDIIRQLNPKCQLIISTHSPSMFGKGWSDKIFFVEDIINL